MAEGSSRKEETLPALSSEATAWWVPLRLHCGELGIVEIILTPACGATTNELFFDLAHPDFAPRPAIALRIGLHLCGDHGHAGLRGRA